MHCRASSNKRHLMNMDKPWHHVSFNAIHQNRDMFANKPHARDASITWNIHYNTPLPKYFQAYIVKCSRPSVFPGCTVSTMNFSFETYLFTSTGTI